MSQQQSQAPLPDPTDWDQMFPGRFLKAADLKGQQLTLTISRVIVEMLPGKPGKGDELKGAVVFSDHAMQLVLNKTNGICLREMFGRKLSAWVGKRVTLYPTETQAFNQTTRRMESTPCIRIWGSPDIAADLTFELTLPRKNPIPTTLRRTGGAPAASRPGSATSTRTASPSKPAAAPLTEAEVLDLQARINAASDPVEVSDLRAEVNGPLKGRLGPAAAVIRAAFESADERCGVPPT